MNNTRAEHLEWCKQRAIQYADTGDWQGAMAFMLSNIRKHPETANHPAAQIGLMLMMTGNIKDAASAKKFIQGFN